VFAENAGMPSTQNKRPACIKQIELVSCEKLGQQVYEYNLLYY
jgi:hypothetical protein